MAIELLDIDCMTPKEKAKKLVRKFKGFSKVMHNGDVLSAKQCALIVVDEIFSLPHDHLKFISVDNNYWQHVKDEIKKIH